MGIKSNLVLLGSWLLVSSTVGATPFDFSRLVPASTLSGCDPFLAPETVGRTIVEKLAPFNEGRLYERQTLEIPMMVMSDIAKEHAHGFASDRFFYDRRSITELYHAGLFVEPIDGAVEIRQDTTNKSRWLPHIILQGLSQLFRIQSPLEALKGLLPPNMAELLPKLQSQPPSIERDLFQAPISDYFSYVLMLIRKPELSPTLTAIIEQERTGPHEGDLKGRLLESVKLEEPLSEILFVSDRKLEIGSSAQDGFLGLVGWTRTRYFRIESFTAHEIQRQNFEAAIADRWTSKRRLPPGDVRPQQLYARFGIHEGRQSLSVSRGSSTHLAYGPNIPAVFEAAQMSIDLNRYYRDDDYRENTVWPLFNHEIFYLPENLRFDGSVDWYLEAMKMSRLGEYEPEIPLVRLAMGAIANSLAGFGDLAARQPQRPTGLNLFGNVPSMFVRLAIIELKNNGQVRKDFVVRFNDWMKSHGMPMQLSEDYSELANFQDAHEDHAKKGYPLFVLKVFHGETGSAQYLIHADDIIYTTSRTYLRNNVLFVEPVALSKW